MSALLPLASAAGLLVLALVIVVLAKVGLEWALALDIDQVLFEEDNHAVALAAGGYYAGVTAVLWSALTGVERSYFEDLFSTGVHGAAGVVLLACGVRLAGPVLLPAFHVRQELVRDRNAGTGVVVGAAALATGLIAAGAIQGNAPGGMAGGLLSALAAFVIGQASLGLVTRLYAKVVGFDAHAEILHDNTAAGCALAGALIGNGILLGWGVSGDLDPARPLATLAPLGAALLASALLIPVVRLLVSRLFFAGIPFAVEIQRDRNLAAGIVDLLIHTLLAVLVVRLLA